MKFAIIHLSDIHMDDQWLFTDVVNKITNQVESFDVGKVIVAISGDLTQSGESKQFDRVYNFLEQIKNNLKNTYASAEVVFVPGNHDIQYKENETRPRSSLKKVTDEYYFEKIDSELERFSNFYSFSELFCMPNNAIKDGFQMNCVDIPLYNDIKVRFYLLNNVTFSTYNDKKNDNSCGAVHIPHSLFDSISQDPNTINCLMMHFPSYYFDESTMQSFKKAAYKLTYVLTGHIHENESVLMSSSEALCSFSSSPALYKESVNRLGMSIIIFDLDDKKICRHSYFLSNANTFVANKNIDTSYIRMINGANPLLKNQNFCYDISHNDYDSISLNNYFVFPELFSNRSESLQKIDTLDSLINYFGKKNSIFIDGSAQSGKTSLLYKLFFDLDAIGVPLYIDLSHYSNITEESFKKIVESELNTEYQDTYASDVFYSVDKNQRIALIDNFCLGNDSRNIFDIISNIFGKIIFASSGTSYGLTEIERIASKSLLDESVSFYELRPMFKQKRYELVEKRFSAICIQKNKKITEDKIEAIYQKVQTILDKYIGNDSNYPYFINKVISAVLDDGIDIGTQKNKIYSKIYESFISAIIMDACQNQDYAVIAHEVLKEIANKIIDSVSYKISRQDFYSTIEEFFRKKCICNISIDELVSKLLRKKILISTSDNTAYAFGSSDFLAYFAANYYSELLNNDFENNKQLIIKYLNNNYDDVISKFILFLVSLASKKTAVYLINLAEEFISSFNDYEIVNEEMALNDEEFKYLHPLSKKDKQELRAKISEKESERYERQREEYRKNVDEGKPTITDEEISLYHKGFGLLEIISGMIPDIKVMLDYDYQERCIKVLYKLPLIIYRLVVGPISDNYDFVATKIKEFLEKNGKTISQDTARSVVIDYCRATFLSLIDHSVRRAHTKLTENDLRKREYADTDTKKIIRLMTSMHDENPDESFEKYAESYFQYFRSNPFARNCISLMVRNYVSWYLSEEKAITKKDFLKLFLKDEKLVDKTIRANLQGKKEKLL